MTDFEEYQEKKWQQRGYTESYFSAMKRRLNLQTIGTYIRSGDTKTVVNNDSFQHRENEAYSKLKKMIAEKCGEETDNVIDQINSYSCVIEEIYFNLGLKAGVILHEKMTDNLETDI
ncbi:MAG: hypothetical protein KHW87_08690 [Clostridiales bacterium]|nr:hypothetical protein [Clostridiales bacterium]